MSALTVPADTVELEFELSVCSLRSVTNDLDEKETGDPCDPELRGRP